MPKCNVCESCLANAVRPIDISRHEWVEPATLQIDGSTIKVQVLMLGGEIHIVPVMKDFGTLHDIMTDSMLKYVEGPR